MARTRSLKPQLNQIRTWVSQGRTDAWIAHQLESTVQQILTFKREHDLVAGDPNDPAAPQDVDLRAEDDALVAAELEKAEQEKREAEERAAAEAAEREAAEAAERQRRRDAGEDDEDAAEEPDEDDRPRRRRRGGGRRRGGAKSRSTFEATFDHGEEGYGLWLDPAVADATVYAENWAGHRPVEVTVEADRIVISRAGEGAGDDGQD